MAGLMGLVRRGSGTKEKAKVTEAKGEEIGLVGLDLEAILLYLES